MRWAIGLLALVVPVCAYATAASAADPLSLDSFSGVAVAGAEATSGEPSWVNGGEGKLETGRGVIVPFGSAIVEWHPVLPDRFGIVVSADAQSLANSVIGLDEAYVTFRPERDDAVSISARAGLFFPPVSLEHDGSGWSLSRTLTPSAINSWIANEVKVAGVEATLHTAFVNRPLNLTLAAFEGDQTAGALLAFRGWALDDLRATLGGTFDLPPLPPRFIGRQAIETDSIDEVDGRLGGYGKIDYEPRDNLEVDLFGYDNNGSITALKDGQYAWRTRFVQASVRWTPRQDAEVLAQAMTGDTLMGIPVNGQTPVNIGFAAAYVLVSQTTSAGTATLRVDQFSISDHVFTALYNLAESGWSGTADWAMKLSERSQLVFEGIWLSSDRPDRARLGERPDQQSLQARAAFRTDF